MSKAAHAAIVAFTWALSVGFTTAIAHEQEEATMTQTDKHSPPNALMTFDTGGGTSYFVLSVTPVQANENAFQLDNDGVPSGNGDYYLEYSTLSENGEKGYSKGNYSLWFKRLHIIPEGEIYKIRLSTFNAAFFTDGEMRGNGWTQQEWMPAGYSTDENSFAAEVLRYYVNKVAPKAPPDLPR